MVLGEQVRVDPFVEFGDGIDRCGDKLADLARRDVRRHRIDGFDFGEFVVLVGSYDVVGVHDLAAALIVADLARGDDGLADLERFFQPLTVGVEIGERDEAGVVTQADLGGKLRAGVLQLVDRAGDGGDLADLDAVDGGAVAAVDPAGGQVEEQVENGLAVDQPGEDRTHLGADAGKAVYVGIEGIEDRIAHISYC